MEDGSNNNSSEGMSEHNGPGDNSAYAFGEEFQTYLDKYKRDSLDNFMDPTRSTSLYVDDPLAETAPTVTPTQPSEMPSNSAMTHRPRPQLVKLSSSMF